ncbi:MAG: hypothetical protein OXE92_04620 [Bacteroidetes bacterium]|nr:hypothetical protein [Bacteroidota bacterium]MCY4204993.1 hypothetical protein [Bacteroidota bacterium]
MYRVQDSDSHESTLREWLAPDTTGMEMPYRVGYILRGRMEADGRAENN